MFVQIARRLDVLGRRLFRNGRREIMHRAQLRVGHQAAQHIDAGAVRQIHVMDGFEMRLLVLQPRRMPAIGITEEREDREFVEGREVLHPVAQAARHDGGVIGEPAGAVAIDPAAAIVERQRQIPMIQAHPGLDARFEHGIGDAIVEIETRLIDRTRARRLDARPRGGEAISADAQLLHQRDIVLVAMIMVARDVAGMAERHAADLLALGIPDALAAPVFVDRTLDLIARRRGAPHEALRPR